MKDSRLINMISIVIIAVVCVMAFWDIGNFIFAQGIPLLTVDSPIIFPFLISMVLLACFLPIVIGEIKSWAAGKTSSQDNQDNAEIIKDLKAVVVYFIGTVVYIMLLKNLHFILGTILYIFTVMFLLHESNRYIERIYKIIIPCLVTIPVIYFVFNGIFKVILP